MTQRLWLLMMIFLAGLIGLGLLWWSNGPGKDLEADFPLPLKLFNDRNPRAWPGKDLEADFPLPGDLVSLGKLDEDWAVTHAPELFRATWADSLGKLDEDWAVTSLDGREVRAGDLRGKVLFINHWATWCPPCVQEMPSIQGLYESLQDSGIVFLIVSQEQPGKVKSFVRDKGWDLPIFLALERFPPVLETDGIPATFVVNRQGDVVYLHVGLRNWNTDAVRNFLKSIP